MVKSKNTGEAPNSSTVDNTTVGQAEIPSAMRNLLADAAGNLVSIAFSQASAAASKAEGPHGKAMVQMFDKLQDAFKKDFSMMLPDIDTKGPAVDDRGNHDNQHQTNS